MVGDLHDRDRSADRSGGNLPGADLAKEFEHHQQRILSLLDPAGDDFANRPGADECLLRFEPESAFRMVPLAVFDPAELRRSAAGQFQFDLRARQ